MTRLVHYLSNVSTCTWEATSAGLVTASPIPGGEAIAVIDVPDETHVVGAMPLLRRGSDAALLRRKRLDREFPGTQLAALVSIRNQASEGTSDIVMVAVDSAGRFTAAIEQLAGQQALRGVYTPALLAGTWITRAGQRDRRVLVVMPTPAGLRLIFVDRGKPLLSRLMPAEGGEATEIARTVQYLQNTQRVEREQSVEIWFWGMEQEKIDACLPATGSCHAGEVPVVDGLPDPVQDGFSALLAMAAARPPWAQLAPDRLRGGWHARQLGRWSAGLAASILLLGAGSAAIVAHDGNALRNESKALQYQAAELASSRESIDARLATHKLDVDDLLVLPEAANLLRRTSVSLVEVFTLAGRVFGSRPEVQLDSLVFHLSSPVPVVEQAGRECAHEVVTADIALEASFTLADSLDVRRHAEALAHVRKELSRSEPWSATLPSAQIGESSPLWVKVGATNAGEEDAWTICLTRGGSV